MYIEERIHGNVELKQFIPHGWFTSHIHAQNGENIQVGNFIQVHGT